MKFTIWQKDIIVKAVFYYLDLYVDFHFRDLKVLINLFQNKFEAKWQIWMMNWFYFILLVPNFWFLHVIA